MKICFEIAFSIFDTIKIVKEKIKEKIDASSDKIKSDSKEITTDVWQ